jgi:hypothetical protein
VRTFPFASFTTAVSVVVDPEAMLVDAGVTVTVPTGTRLTVTVADPDCPSLVAVIVAVPGATPVTTPLGDTVAIDPLFVVQMTVRPVSVLPFASLVTALSVVVPATKIVAVAGETVTVATGAGGAAVTVIVAVPVFPSLVAVIVAVPGATPVTTPLGDTVAIDPLLVVQTMERPVSVLPFASFVIAERVVVVWTTTVAVDGETVTVATGAAGAAFTVMVAVPDFPSLVAVIVAVPGATPVTTPA